MSSIFWSNIFKAGDSELQQISILWQQTALFENIPFRHIQFLADKMHRRQYKADEIIFNLGDQGAGAILVIEGSVRIKANEIQLALLEPGDFFGEIALAETEKRTADAYAVGATSLSYFLKQDLEEWIEYEPVLGAKFLMNLASVLARRLYEANQIIASNQV